MTWMDWSLIAVLILFLAVGARMGSLWTAACLGAGFVGAVVSDTYALPVAGWMGSFPGADVLAVVALFAAGAVGVLIPGWILSKICKGLFLGMVDSAFGLFTGAVAGVLATAVLLLLVVPFFPSVETWKAWRESSVVRPLHVTFENLLGAHATSRVSAAPRKGLHPIQERVRSGIKGVAGRAAERLKG